MSLMQTPAAVVVDKALLSEQASETLQDSIRNISGMTQAGNNYGIGDDLPNDTDADGDGIYGEQLTEAQRDELASTILPTDGLLPYSLGDSGLISPLSEPNEGKELRFKLRQDLSITNDLMLTQQIQYRDYSSEFTRQTGGLNYIYWDRNGEINADPRSPLLIDDVLYPYAARRQEYRHQIAEEKTWQYFLDLKNTWSSGTFSGEHFVVERLNIGGILGLLIAIIGYFYSNRLLPIMLQDRAVAEVNVFY